MPEAPTEYLTNENLFEVPDTGFMAKTGVGTAVARTITGTAARVSVANGNGVAGNPIIDLDAAVIATLGDVDGKLAKTGGTMTGAIILPNADPTDPNHAARKAYVDGIVAAQDAMVFKGVIDCSANPNYPAADRGWTYRASVAGKIGGASGKVVEVGDIMLCLTDATASGNEATVGAQWSVIQVNIDGALTTAAIGVTLHAYNALLAAIAGLGANGLIARTASGAAAARTIVLTANELAGSNLDGQAGNPSIGLAPTAQLWRVLASDATGWTHTGNTTETTMVTVNLPAPNNGPNGWLRITTLWSTPVNDASAKNGRVRIGGTEVDRSYLVSNRAHSKMTSLRNRGATNSQIASGATAQNSHSVTGAAVSTYSFDMTGPLTITFTIQNAANGDSTTLEYYLIEALYG